MQESSSKLVLGDADLFNPSAFLPLLVRNSVRPSPRKSGITATPSNNSGGALDTRVRDRMSGADISEESHFGLVLRLHNLDQVVQ